jgi:hypothetical protein
LSVNMRSVGGKKSDLSIMDEKYIEYTT